MKEMDVIKINNIDYIVMDEIKNNETLYVFLSNPDDPKDFFVRKVVDSKGDFLIKLDSEEELKFALKLFNEKNAKDFF